MAGSWDHILRAFQKGHKVSPPELREEPASIEPGNPTSTTQEGTKKRTPRKTQKVQPKAP